jgi:hypothetical protein
MLVEVANHVATSQLNAVTLVRCRVGTFSLALTR